MAGADLSLVTVGLSLTVANGFPSLQEDSGKKCSNLRAISRLLSENWTSSESGHISYPRKVTFALPFIIETCQVQENKSFMMEWRQILQQNTNKAGLPDSFWKIAHWQLGPSLPASRALQLGFSMTFFTLKPQTWHLENLDKLEPDLYRSLSLLLRGHRMDDKVKEM